VWGKSFDGGVGTCGWFEKNAATSVDKRTAGGSFARKLRNTASLTRQLGGKRLGETNSCIGTEPRSSARG